MAARCQAQAHGPPPAQAPDLDGTNSAVELPPNIFKDLDRATIEVWVKFRDLAQSRSYSYGGFQQDLCIGRRVAPRSGLDVVANQNGLLD